MTQPPEDEQHGTDSWASAAADPLDISASDALEERIAGGETDDREVGVSARAAEMGSVRDLLADDSDAPTDARLEQLLVDALSGTAGQSPGSRERTDLGTVPVPVRSRDDSPKRSWKRRWPVVAAAAAAVLVVGAVGVANFGTMTGDSASGVATDATAEAESAEAESADAQAVPTPEYLPDDPARVTGESDDRGTSGVDLDADDSPTSPFEEGAGPQGPTAGGSTVLGEAGSTPSPAGLEFTIVVPIDPG